MAKVDAEQDPSMSALTRIIVSPIEWHSHSGPTLEVAGEKNRPGLSPCNNVKAASEEAGGKSACFEGIPRVAWEHEKSSVLENPADVVE